MTETEAIATLHTQLLSERGFLPRLQRGEGLDRVGVAALYAALEALAACWAERTEVPKAALLPLVDLSGSLLACSRTQPDLAEILERLAFDLMERVETVVFGGSSRLSYEQAAAIVYTHLGGLPSVALALRHRERLYAGWTDELRQALDVLAVAWSERSAVPRVVAGSMLEGCEFIRGHAGNYPPTQQSELEAIADELAVRIRRCLQDDTR
jgi:hypothetical protein